MNTYLAQKQSDKAIAAVNEQIAKVPESSEFYDLLGTALFNNRKTLPEQKRHSRNPSNSIRTMSMLWSSWGRF